MKEDKLIEYTFKTDSNYIYDIGLEYYIKNLIKKDVDVLNKTIIISAIDELGISLAGLSRKYNFKAIVVLPNDIDINIINKIEELGGDVILVPAQYGIDEVNLMASDMKLEIPDSILINPFEEKVLVSAYFKIAGSILDNDIKEIDTLVIPIKYGFVISGISKYFKMNYDTEIIGVKRINIDTPLVDDDLVDEIVSEHISMKYDNKNVVILKM